MIFFISVHFLGEILKENGEKMFSQNQKIKKSQKKFKRSPTLFIRVICTT